MKIAGFDIGGANTDLAIIDFDEGGDINNIRVDFSYLPMWMKKEELGNALLELIGDEIDQVDAVGISMTAELVDAYQTKKEGVLDIANRVKNTFDIPVGFVGLQKMMNLDELYSDPLQAAAANWMATSQIATIMSENCIMVDVGSTTTDIIPIKDGSECAKGRSDLERLGTGELVYTGTLRTNVAALVDKVPLDDSWFRVSSELFAISADVHNILGNIKVEDYSCDTPDGAGKSKEDSMRRIARVLCGDLDVLSHLDIISVCDYIYYKQALRISEAIMEVSEREIIGNVVTTGLGMNVLAAKAAEMVGIDSIGMDDFLTTEECVVAPAVGTALMMEEHLNSK
ncbi:hydantoinase/oxoprolinase family protein [Methanobacterium alcaliphilum]|uniref:hydantoinase/oxoprolinase family protein n=1 Tax=Methanobacterium alcaliphilum TaxID=392018 RepID=UPI00200B18C1|nr:hydantoinase/oxoprolinase family protein [Methanobacterium alcaliphilum]MCK9150901.1 H4MPT-linked C1 transfer pathway protein [Methanobacterium alcaliphilum]